MSSVGGAGWLPPTPLVSSTAGVAGQRRIAESDALQADKASRDQQHQQRLSAERAVSDVTDPSQTGDRDADGRLPWTFTGRGNAAGDLQPGTASQADDQGGLLDVQV
ncbi:MAG: hypothetical protein KatS3mg113_0222 [Planctomycetaceae bacterium]|nr:MAG: hypothetical protein KatS3mg113_0222 [Planctomycetaceae bacterium]